MILERVAKTSLVCILISFLIYPGLSFSGENEKHETLTSDLTSFGSEPEESEEVVVTGSILIEAAPIRDQVDQTVLKTIYAQGFASALRELHLETRRAAIEFGFRSKNFFFESLSDADALVLANTFAEFIKNSPQDRGVDRLYAVQALGAIGPPARDHIPLLIELLSDEEFEVAYDSAQALLKLARYTKPYIPKLALLIQDENFEDKDRIVELFGNLGDLAKDHVPLLIECLIEDSSEWHRSPAVAALGNLGSVVKDHIQDIADLTNHEDQHVRVYAIEVLGLLSTHAREQVPLLVINLEDPDPKIRQAALKALISIGTYAKDLVTEIGKLLNHPVSEVKLSALEILKGLGPKAGSQASNVARLLGDTDNELKIAAIQTLGGFGERAQPYLLDVLNLLEDESGRLIATAGQELAKHPEFLALYKDRLVQLVKSERKETSWEALALIGSLGKHGQEQIPLVLNLVGHENSTFRYVANKSIEMLLTDADDPAVLIGLISHSEKTVRDSAIKGLRKFNGQLTREHYSTFVPLLESAGADIRISAIEAVAEFGRLAEPEIPWLIGLLSSDDDSIRSAAGDALVRFGSASRAHMDSIILALSHENALVRYSVYEVLSDLSEYLEEYAPALGHLLTLGNNDVTDLALRLLGLIGEPAASELSMVETILKHPDEDLKMTAIQSIGMFGPSASELAPRIAKYLDLKSDRYDRSTVFQSMLKVGPPKENLRITPYILEQGYRNIDLLGRSQFVSYLFSGADADTKLVNRWLNPFYSEELFERASKERLFRVSSLAAISKFLPYTSDSPLVRSAAQRIANRFVTELDWTTQDVELLSSISPHLDQSGQLSVETRLSELQSGQRFFLGMGMFTLHALFWLILVFGYPRSPSIQAIFFWNKWVRRIAGFGYVGFVLAWVPYFRNKLFEPFNRSLLADAKLEEFQIQPYFVDSSVRAASGSTIPVQDLLEQRRGQLVLEGESGLGKSFFARKWAQKSEGLAVFLLASDCSGGVVEAIRAKLQGPAQDADYLSKLIFAGALDVVVDGLNEVSADTRALIVDFAKRFFQGNLLITTQPIVWSPPSLSSIYVLLPLEPSKTLKFLKMQYSVSVLESTDGNILEKEQFHNRCEEFVASSLEIGAREQASSILSNPMDLSLVATMLVRGYEPNVYELLDQYYKVMASEYRRVHVGNDFPLESFCERVYYLKINDIPAFPEGDHFNELAVMAKFKMVVPYHTQDSSMESVPGYTFRHDKIMDYFLVFAFKGDRNQRPEEHLGDPRFRGTYLQLATLLPLDAAQALERLLIDFAADTKDHSVSDKFVQLLRGRREGVISGQEN